jgi:protoheme IX farnesyltransferase
MLPLINGVESTKLNIFIYSLLMLPVIIFPYWINFVGLVFLIPSLLLTLYYNYLCYELYNYKKNKFKPKKAKSIFGYSILYLFLVFVLFLIDKIL